MKKKILFVGAFKDKTTSGGTGGQLFACNSLVNSSLNDDIEWILLDTTATTNQDRTFASRLSASFRRWYHFLKILLLGSIDGVFIFSSHGFSFLEKGMMALIARVFRKKVCFAPRSGIILNDISNSKIMAFYIKFVLKNVSHVLCQGDSWKSFYHQFAGGNSSKYIVLHNWLDVQHYINNRPVYSTENTKKIHILFLGWIEQNKGVFELLEAIDIVRNLPIQVSMGGNGRDIERLQQLMIEKKLTNTVSLLSWVHKEQKMSLLQTTDIFVLPSYKEGYPNALLEAMASGIPSIASNVGGVPDIITDGVNGCLITPKNSQMLAEKIKYLVENEAIRMEMSKKAKSTVLQNNQLQTAVEILKNLFATY